MNYGIIAAGEGSRLVQEGIKTPKPLIPLNGVPMLKRLIAIFLKNNAESISIIVNEEMTQVYDFLKGLSLPIPLHIIRKSTPSSMHSFHELKPYLNQGNFCLTTVDTIFKESEFADYIHTFEHELSDDGLFAVTSHIDDEKPLYIETDETDKVTAFLDSTENPRYISGGIYALKPEKAFAVLEKCINTGVFRMRNYQRELINNRLSIRAHAFSKILDVDHAEDIKKAEMFLRN